MHENQYSRQGIRGEFERMERETGIEPATSSLGSFITVDAGACRSCSNLPKDRKIADTSRFLHNSAFLC